jgi:hypothetical protein
LESESESLNDLISKNKVLCLNASSAHEVKPNDGKSWRMRGEQENWNFYADMITSMQDRVNQFSHTIGCIEEAIVGFQNHAPFSPSSVGAVLDHQHKMYLSLAGRVAELHQEADRIVKRRKLTK